MKSYKFYLRDRQDVVIGGGAFDAEDDDVAVSIVRVRSASGPQSYHSYELLTDNGVVRCETLRPPSRTKPTG